MPNFTANYNFNLPLVNDPTDEDLWGGELNANWSAIDTILNTRTQPYNFSDFQIQSPIIKDYSELVNVAGNIIGPITVDLSLGNHYAVTLIGNVTFTFTNPSPTGNAMPIFFYLKQDATGSRLVTWPASVVWPAGIAPFLTTVANRTDEIVLITRNSGTSYSGSVRGYNYNI